MRDNCIRKKRGPKGRKWLEEKGLISDRKKEHEGENGRERRAHLPPAVRYMLTLSLCVNTHCMCACWYRSVNPSLASYLIAVPSRLFKNLHVSLAWSLLFSSYSNFHIATLNLKKRPGKTKFSSFVTSCSNLFGNKISQITFNTVWIITKYCLVWSWDLLWAMSLHFIILPSLLHVSLSSSVCHLPICFFCLSPFTSFASAVLSQCISCASLSMNLLPLLSLQLSLSFLCSLFPGGLPFVIDPLPRVSGHWLALSVSLELPVNTYQVWPPSALWSESRGEREIHEMLHSTGR